ncbi:hypothetical protein B1A87_013430 [Arthrobacter sp. KBS0703]|uniref:hypothetical protein n=1 Tax=Arthrobacter sp. KBS0703 TaxID=1955698 RepID=UPI00098F68F7|nr:hypothetical protein [Arthrobacter sp. KBS0703]TSE16689.1 hypothetical protein B1A87_013430 [Arthrobacter sp. KBS0703]
MSSPAHHAVAESIDWSDHHRADEQFHQLVGTAPGLGTAVELYHEKLAALRDHPVFRGSIHV